MAATMDDIAHLIVTPFHEIVDKGKTAVANATDDQTMLKAATSLVKEGERALKKIGPLCERQLEEFGLNFRDALRDNEEIAEYRTHLNDLLWEFDDYIDDSESFDAEKYTELQQASRKAAPKIYDILMTMKLEVPALDTLSPVGSLPQSINSPMSPSSRLSLVVTPSQQAYQNHHHLSMSSSSTARHSSTGEIRTVEDATQQLEKLMSLDSDTVSINLEAQEQDQEQRPPPLQSAAAPPRPPPPMPPLTNPWDVKVAPTLDESNANHGEPVERRPPVGRAGSESPVDPTMSSVSNGQQHNDKTQTGAPQIESLSGDAGAQHGDYLNRGMPQGGEYVVSGAANADQRDDRFHLPSNFAMSPNTAGYYNVSAGPASRPRNVSKSSGLSSVIPEDALVNSTGGLSYLASPPTSQPASRNDSRGYSVDPAFSGFASARHPSLITDHNTPPPQQSPAVPTTLVPGHGRSASTQLSPKTRPVSVFASEGEGGLEVAPSFQAQLDSELPIPVEVEENAARDLARPSSGPPAADCSITAGSSFWLNKGFCEGAKEVSRGGIGVKKAKKPVGFTTSATVARCTSCMCELDFKNIENDLNKLDSGNFRRAGINYRIRFLQKSHLPAKRDDDVLYGCLFCVQLGHTLDPSDATVYFTPAALMDHIARHPRPLPEVAGIDVVMGDEVPERLHNNFDLQIRTDVPEPHPVVAVRAEIASLPSGVTKDQARRLYGKRLLFDRTPALELGIGARVTGIEWPARYNGEWAMAWHDGKRESVPTDLIKLDTPPNQHVKLGGTSMIRARTRWKFRPAQDKGGDWLKFDKGDVITNISWSYFDHWCWSGTNSKGKWGIFPQAFIDTNTLEEPSGLNRVTSLKDEKNRSTSFISKFGRKTSSSTTLQPGGGGLGVGVGVTIGGRPPSVAGSTSSHESRGLNLNVGGGGGGGGFGRVGDVHAS